MIFAISCSLFFIISGLWSLYSGETLWFRYTPRMISARSGAIFSLSNLGFSYVSRRLAILTISIAHAGTVLVEITRSMGARSICFTASSVNNACDSTTLIFFAPCSFRIFATRQIVSPVSE